MLEVRGLTVGHDGVDVVHGLDLAVAAGEVMALLGRNGAGRTTALGALCGLLPARDGSVRLDGEEVLGLPTHELARRGLAHVPAARHLFPGMTVGENLALGAHPARPDPAVLRRVHELFPVLADRARQRAGTLSGGEQQMLAVGRALLGEPRVLVLDEPTSGLAPRPARAAWEALASLAATGTAVLVAEQQVDLVRDLADRAVVLDAGRLSWAGPAATLDRDDRLRRAYLGDA